MTVAYWVVLVMLAFLLWAYIAPLDVLRWLIRLKRAWRQRLITHVGNNIYDEITHNIRERMTRHGVPREAVDAILAEEQHTCVQALGEDYVTKKHPQLTLTPFEESL